MPVTEIRGLMPGPRRVLARSAEFAKGIGPGQGTTQRFALMLVLFVAGSLYMFGTVFEQIVDPRGLVFGCQLAAGFNPDSNSPVNGLTLGAPGFNDCVNLNASGWRFVWLPYAATVLVVLLALAHYALHPTWQRRRRRIVPLEKPDPDRVIRETLAALEVRSGLAASPVYVVDTSADGPSARVFGRPGKYTVCLNTGLIALFGRDREAFAATVLHELAHIRNRDVGITYLTVAIWRVFLIGALVPFALSQAWQLFSGLLAPHPSIFLPGAAPGEAGSILLAVCVVGLIYLAMADVLRSREHFADLDAIARGADRVYWLRNLPAVPGGSGRAGIAGRLRAALRTHPSWERRNAVLIRPDDAFSVRASSMFVTGVTAQLLLGFIGTAPVALIGLGEYSWISNNATWPAAALITAVAGLAVWRSTAQETASGRPAASGLRAGAWIGAGQLAGALLLNEATGNGWTLPFPWVLFLGLLVIVPAAILWWTAGCAARWSRIAGARGAVAQATATAVTMAAFAWWLDLWSSDGSFYILGNPNPLSSSFAYFLQGYPYTAATKAIATVLGPLFDVDGWGALLTLALCAVPLIAVRARVVRVIGVAVGCVTAIAVVVVTYQAHGWVGDGFMTLNQNYFVYTAWIFVILLCGSVAAAVIAVLWGRGGAFPAMAAAGITAALGVVAMVAVFGTDGCVGPLAILNRQCYVGWDLNWSDYSLVIQLLFPMLGMITLIAGGLGAGIARMVTGREDQFRAVSDRLGRRHLAWTGIVCVVLAGVAVPAYLGGLSGGSSGSTGGQGQGQAQGYPSIPGAVPAQIQADQLTAWGAMGGVKMINKFESRTGNIVGLNQDASLNKRAVGSACANILAVAEQANSYLSPPNGDAAQMWSSMVNDADSGSRKCLNGIARNNESLVASGMISIYSAYRETYALTEILAPLVRKAGR